MAKLKDLKPPEFYLQEHTYFMGFVCLVEMIGLKVLLKPIHKRKVFILYKNGLEFATITVLDILKDAKAEKQTDSN